MTRNIVIFVIITAILLAFGGAVAETETTLDYFPTDGWQTTTPETQGMDSAVLAQAVTYLQNSNLRPDQLLVIRNGYIVADATFAPYRGGRHDVASVSKSVLSTLLGIAIDNGYIGSVEDTVGRYIGNLVGDNKSDITIHDLITMQSGFVISGNHMVDFYQMMLSGNWTGYLQALQVNESKKGNIFSYNNFTAYLVSLILDEALAHDTEGFADACLMQPLGITDYTLPKAPDGMALRGYGDMAFTAYDLAKIGLLYMNNGVWDGEQILSPEWIAEATCNQTRQFSDSRAYTTGYGYYWWMDDDGHYSARGSGSQRIDVFPAQNIIVVLNARATQSTEAIYEMIHTLYQDYILASVVSDEAIAENEEAALALRQAVSTAAVSRAENIGVDFVQALDAQYLDTAYMLSDNLIGMSRLTVTRETDGLYAVNVSVNPLEGITGIRLPLDVQGEYTYYTGRKQIEGRCRLTAMDANSLSLRMDELGNISEWDITVSFAPNTVTISVADATGNGAGYGNLWGNGVGRGWFPGFCRPSCSAGFGA